MVKDCKLVKAPLKEVMNAIDKLPEQNNALLSEAGRIAYKTASRNLLESMGWTYEDFINFLSIKVNEEDK